MALCPLNLLRGQLPREGEWRGKKPTPKCSRDVMMSHDDCDTPAAGAGALRSSASSDLPPSCWVISSWKDNERQVLPA